MTRDELQAVADTAWIILGPDNFGCNVTCPNGHVCVDIIGFDDAMMYTFSDSFRRTDVENQPGDTRYNYIRELVKSIRTTVSDFHKCRIKQHLHN